MEARRAETIELRERFKNGEGLGSRQPGLRYRGAKLVVPKYFG
jgi:hypothetical protein